MTNELIHSDPASCPYCGMHAYRWMDYSSRVLRFIHPFQDTTEHCIHVGSVYRSDFTFAGWWVDRDFMKLKFRGYA